MPVARPRVLHPVRPSAALVVAYQARLDQLVAEMHRSLLRYVVAAYRRHLPPTVVLAQDETALGIAVRQLARRWQQRFNAAAPDLASYFADTVAQHGDAALARILRRAGIAVRFRMTRAAQAVLAATVQENVTLIRSIAQQHLAAVEQLVARSVALGRDLSVLAPELERQFQLSRRRARLIAKDQTNKATATLQRVRQAEAGIREAVWVHSTAGKVPRPSHLKAGKDRVRYDVTRGWWDPHEKMHIWPGTLVNCRCVSRPVVSGLS